MSVKGRRRDGSGHVDPFAQRRKRFEAVLTPAGVWEMFAEMPRGLQEIFWKFKQPDIVVLGDETLSTGEAGRRVRLEVEQSIRKATFDAAGGEKVRVQDYSSIVVGCILLLREIVAGEKGKEHPRFVREGLPLLEKYDEANGKRATDAMFLAVHGPLLARSEFDRRLYIGGAVREVNERGKHQGQVILGSVEPQARKITLDGRARTMYRLANCGAGGSSWISVSGQQLGRRDLPEEIPIFVQVHALEQLRKRANLPAVQPYLQAWLTESMKELAVIKEIGRGNLMVEFRIQEHRIGYLVVTPRADAVIVRTFLFLTMDQTTAAKLLHKKLRLTRGDREYLGLHELAAFTNTDLRTDPVLRPLMEKCGCGHLFKLVEATDDLAPKPTALAEKMKKYLQLAA